MPDLTRRTVLDDVMSLARMYEPSHGPMLAKLRASGVPLNAEDPPKDPPAKDPPADPPKDPPVTGEFTAADKAALEAVVAKERTERKAHEKAARDALAKLKTLEDADATELEKATKRADEAEAKITAATEKVRKANLVTALADAGLTGARAKAAARLIDGVEFGDDDEPTNLEVRITAAKTEYGEDMFKGAKPSPPGNVNGGEGGNGDKPPTLTAEELSMAASFGMTPVEYEAAKSPGYRPPEPVAAKT